jgi:hypothetical protein
MLTSACSRESRSPSPHPAPRSLHSASADRGAAPARTVSDAPAARLFIPTASAIGIRPGAASRLPIAPSAGKAGRASRTASSRPPRPSQIAEEDACRARSAKRSPPSCPAAAPARSSDGDTSGDGCVGQHRGWGGGRRGAARSVRRPLRRRRAEPPRGRKRSPLQAMKAEPPEPEAPFDARGSLKPVGPLAVNETSGRSNGRRQSRPRARRALDRDPSTMCHSRDGGAAGWPTRSDSSGSVSFGAQGNPRRASAPRVCLATARRLQSSSREVG